MGKAKLVLFSRDSRYADAFSEYCGRHEKERITVKTFTNEESLENYVQKEKVDILLTEDMRAVSETCNGCGIIVFLSESRYVNNAEYPSIYKYQRMDIILKQIYELLAEGIGRESEGCSIGAGGPDIIGCFSPCYEQEREQYARILAEYMGDSGKTLFINMAMFTSYDSEGEEGLSELLYYASNGEDNILSYRLPALSKHMGRYESLPGVRNYLDLYDLDEKLAGQLFHKLSNVSEYKYVIVDIGLIGDVAEIIMGYCNTVFMPVPFDADDRRVNHLKKDYVNATGSDIMERMRFVTLPDWWNINAAGRAEWVRELYEQH